MAIGDIINDGWHGRTMQEVREGLQALLKRLNEAESSGVDVVNNLTEGGIEKALSAEMGKLLKSLLDGKASLIEGTGKLDYGLLPGLVLAGMGAPYDENKSYSPRIGDLYYDSTSGTITYVKTDGTGTIQFAPSPGQVYWNALTRKPWHWIGGNWEAYNPVDVSGKADLLNGMLKPEQWPKTVILNISGNIEGIVEGEGDIVFDSSDYNLKIAAIDNDIADFVYIPIGKPREGTVYTVKSSGEQYRWGGSTTRWVKVGDHGSGCDADSILNINDNKRYRVWVGTADEFADLGGVLDDDAIYLVGVAAGGSQPDEVAIELITITASSSGNSINLVAVLTPSNTTQRGVNWYIRDDDKPYATLVANGLTATLTSRDENADGQTVLVTCVSKSDPSVMGEAPLRLSYTAPEPVTPGVTIADIVFAAAGANQLQCSAVFNPATETDTVAWSVDNTNLAEIDASTGLLTIKASGTVNVTATGTNNTRTEPVQLTYEEQPVTGDITEIGEIHVARVAGQPNTYRLTAEANGDTPTITFELIDCTVPTVNKLVRTESGGETTSTLTDVANVVIDGDLLTFKEDCSIRLRARAGSVVSEQAGFTALTHNGSDAIWFEDEQMLAQLRRMNIGSGSGSAAKVTYDQAAAVRALSVSGNSDIERFKEFKWFAGISSIGDMASGNEVFFRNCPKLSCIALPETVTRFNVRTTCAFSGCGLSEVHVASLEAYCSIAFQVNNQANVTSSFGAAGASANGIGLYVDGEELIDIEIPSSIPVLHAFAFAGFTHIKSVEVHAATIEGNFLKANADTTGTEGQTAVESVTIGDEVTSLPTMAFARVKSLVSADLGTGISALSQNAFRNCTALTSLTLRYKAGVVNQGSAFYNVTKSNIDVYVPQALVNSYVTDWGVYDAQTTPGGFKGIYPLDENNVTPGEGELNG